MTNQNAIKRGIVTRRVLLTLACAAGLAVPVLAQDPGTTPPPQRQAPQGNWQGRGGDRQGHELEHLTKALNLTPDQVTQVKAIQDGGRQQMMAIHQNTNLAPADRRAQMMALRQSQDTKIKAVLTNDQKTKYDAMQAQMHERREERQEGQQSAPPPGL
jgi:Spy/CpxP family protein refolding chaperone